MINQSVTIIIPAFRPDVKFEKLLDRLHRQSVQPASVCVVNTLPEGEEKWWKQKAESICGKYPLVSLRHISQGSFDHGTTRDEAAASVTTDLVIFMTMDAVPADTHLIESLLRAFAEDTSVACAYARQLAAGDAGPVERYTRRFNYPFESYTKGEEDLPQLGIKTYFCSNVCAAYRMDVYRKLGGFRHHMIFNEDMVYAGTAVKAGYKIRYCAEAKVYHSHNYTGIQQFHRNFDLGVSQAQHPEIFENVPSEGEGMRMVKETAVYLLKTGRIWLLPGLVWQSACKLAGYRLGKKYRSLPKMLIKRCTMNRAFWEMTAL